MPEIEQSIDRVIAGPERRSRLNVHRLLGEALAAGVDSAR
jgi:ATP-dependent Zn protease